MTESRSAVVEVMEKASEDAWHEWRRLLKSGAGGTPEAIAAFDRVQLISRTFVGELTSRALAAGPRAA